MYRLPANAKCSFVELARECSVRVIGFSFIRVYYSCWACHSMTAIHQEDYKRVLSFNSFGSYSINDIRFRFKMLIFFFLKNRVFWSLQNLSCWMNTVHWTASKRTLLREAFNILLAMQIVQPIEFGTLVPLMVCRLHKLESDFSQLRDDPKNKIKIRKDKWLLKIYFLKFENLNAQYYFEWKWISQNLILAKSGSLSGSLRFGLEI